MSLRITRREPVVARYNLLMPAQLVQLNISDGGMPKLPIESALVSKNGVAGDRQRNLKYHGGPTRAVCLFSAELYDALKDEGVPLAFGSVGENFTTRGIDLGQLQSGDRMQVGQAIIQITTIRRPCANLKKWHRNLPEMILGRSGWYASVIREAIVRPGDEIKILPRSAFPATTDAE